MYSQCTSSCLLPLQVVTAEEAHGQASSAHHSAGVANSRPTSANAHWTNDKHKTELCTYFLWDQCSRGAECLYAHAADEIRRPAPVSLQCVIALSWQYFVSMVLLLVVLLLLLVNCLARYLSGLLASL